MDRNLEALRRRAFSREGTADDLRLLAQAEPPRAPDAAGPATDDRLPAVAEAADGPEDADRTEDAPPRPRRRRWLPVLTGVVGLSLGAGVGAFATMATVGAPDDSLRVFDRPALGPPSGLTMPVGDVFPNPDAEIRYLGPAQDAHVFASRTLLRSGGAEICLGVVEGDLAGIACTSDEEFRRWGITLYSGDSGVAWGPTGDEIRIAESPLNSR